jgi:hypothetical protein
MGEVLSYTKGRYKVHYDRQCGAAASHKDYFYKATEMPRLLKTTAAVPGTRLEIYWPQEKRYYKALIKTEHPRKRENYLICYEERKNNTDREWIDLHRHKFRILEVPLNNAMRCEKESSYVHKEHPKEVVVVQRDQADENDDSGSDSWGKITTKCTDDRRHGDNLLQRTGGSNTINMDLHNNEADDDISPRNVLSSHFPQMKQICSSVLVGDESEKSSLDFSPKCLPVTRGVIIGNHGQPASAVTRGSDDIDGKQIESNGGTFHRFSERVSPGSTSTSRSVVNVSECEVISPNLVKSFSNDGQSDNDVDKAVTRNSPSESNQLKCEKIILDRTCSAESSVSALEKYDTKEHGNEYEEGVIIDPDSDPATRSAVCSLIEVGSRVAVYWDHDKNFFPGTITDRSFRGKPFFLEYDDGDEEWIDLRKHRFRLLPSKVNSSDPTDLNSSRSRRRCSNTSEDATVVKKKNQQSLESLSKNCKTSTNALELRGTRSATRSHADRSKLHPKARNDLRPKRVIYKKIVVDSSESSASEEEYDKISSLRTNRKKRPIGRRDQVDDDIAKISVGSRVAIWWGGDKQYYNGVVHRQRNRIKPFYFVYDDGLQEEWIDFKQHKFKLLSDKALSRNDKKGNEEKEKDTLHEELEFSSKPGMKRGRSTTVVKQRHNSPSSQKKQRTGKEMESRSSADSLQHGSKGDSTVDLYNNITVGTRVAVYWEGDSKYYEGVVTRERKDSKRRHYLEYDDGEAAHWIDFREHWVRELPDDEQTRTRKSNSKTEVKRKAGNVESPAKQKVKISTASSDAAKRKVEKVPTKQKVEGSISASAAGKRKIGKVQGADKQKLESSSVAGKRKVEKVPTKQKDAKSRSASDAANRKVEKVPARQKIGKSCSTSDAVTRKVEEVQRSAKQKVEDSCDASNVKIGSRVEIWWTGDEAFYKGTVTKIASRMFFVKYDDGEEEWVSFTQQIFRILDTNVNKHSKNQVQVVIDDEMDSDLDDNATSESSDSEDHLAYDDFIFGKVDNLRVGSRISVWWTGNKRYFDGTIKKIDERPGTRRPFFIKYDDHDEEWTDLRRRYYRVLG